MKVTERAFMFCSVIMTNLLMVATFYNILISALEKKTLYNESVIIIIPDDGFFIL